MVLSLHRDLDSLVGICGSFDWDIMDSPIPTPLGDESLGATPVVGSVIPNGWKNILVGSKVANVHMADPKIAHNDNGLVISFLDTLVDSVTSSLKLWVVRRFVAFRPTIEMV